MPADKDVVRGHVYLSGYIAESVPGSNVCRVIYIASVDPCGSIPAAIANQVGRKDADKIRQRYVAALGAALPCATDENGSLRLPLSLSW